MSGMVMLFSAFAIRNSAAAGPRWYQADIGLRGENGEIDYVNLRNYDPFASILALSEVVNAASEGRSIEDVLTTSEALDMVAGIRSLENTGLKYTDAFREFNPEGDVLGQVSEITQKLVGSTVGMASVFFRQAKDLAAITDMRIPGVFKGAEENKFLTTGS